MENEWQTATKPLNFIVVVFRAVVHLKAVLRIPTQTDFDPDEGRQQLPTTKENVMKFHSKRCSL
jgi:hypothetical protein